MTGRGERISTTQTWRDTAEIIRAFPDEFRERLAAELRAFQPKLLARMRAGVPTRKGPRQATFRTGGAARPAGGLVSLLDTAFDPERLSVRGGLLTPETRSLGFYGFILDAGRGLKRQRSRPRTRTLRGMTTVGRARIGRYTRPYTRAISPILPGRYDIAFGRLRQWARAEIGPVLIRVYDAAVIKLLWRNL